MISFFAFDFDLVIVVSVAEDVVQRFVAASPGKSVNSAEL